jgi:hypothetical protein
VIATARACQETGLTGSTLLDKSVLLRPSQKETP